jgi:calcineurin-like phosphoesterase family protein
MTTFYISDTHFSHEKIISLAKRPFKTIGEMNVILIRNWNSIVKQDDTVFFLGDFAWGKHSSWFERLSGNKILIRGNHDEDVEDLPWYAKHDYLEVEDGPFKIVLFHYPILEWNGMFKGYYHFYGHVHGNDMHMPINWSARAFDVGVESIGYKPRTAEEIIMKGNR